MHGILYMTSRWLYMKTIAVLRTVAMGIYQRNAFIMKYGKKYINVTFLFPSWADCILQYSLNDFYSVHESSSNTARPYRTCKTESRLNVSPCPHVYPYLHFDHCCTIVVVGRIGESEVVRRTNGVTWLQRLCRRKVRCILP